jgi:hypothetical protein
VRGPPSEKNPAAPSTRRVIFCMVCFSNLTTAKALGLEVSSMQSPAPTK